MFERLFNCYQIKQNLNGFKSMQYHSFANTSYLHEISSADGFWQKKAWKLLDLITFHFQSET